MSCGAGLRDLLRAGWIRAPAVPGTARWPAMGTPARAAGDRDSETRTPSATARALEVRHIGAASSHNAGLGASRPPREMFAARVGGPLWAAWAAGRCDAGASGGAEPCAGLRAPHRAAWRERGGSRALSGKAEDARHGEEALYEKKTQVEHVLHRPDVYVGSMEATERQMLVYDLKAREVAFRSVSYVPGLLKIFDEILVNAADNKMRDPSMDRIEVTIDEKKKSVSVWNNGKGIPVIKHSLYEDVYVPELVMGNLLAGSNFDDSKKRLGGGRHGYGAKLTNIFSTAFSVETADSARRLVYKQTWRDNMSVCEPAIITPMDSAATDYTRVTFCVDLKRFSKKAARLDKDIVALWARRVLDVAGCCPGVKCVLNGKLVRVKGMADLAQKYLAAIDATSSNRAQSDVEPAPEGTALDAGPGTDIGTGIVELSDPLGRWKVAVAAGRGGAGGSSSAASVSYVNSIWTPRGGTHLKHVMDQVVEAVLSHVQKVHRDLDVTERQVRSQLWVCVSALIENPSFDSQVCLS
jgi:DNA topoisomerase II